MKRLQLQNTWLCLSAISMAGWMSACSKSDAATIADDESSIHHRHRNYHHHGHDHDEDNDWSDGHGRRCRCTSYGHCADVEEYDDFSDATTYNSKWLDISRMVGQVEPEALSSRTSAGGQLHIEATPFVTSQDFALDHMKYFAVSKKSWEVPLRGSIQVSADIDATTSGTNWNRNCHDSNDRMYEPRQAAATLELVDARVTGIHLAWYISSNRAMAVYERTSLDGSCDLEHNFTQIVQEVAISPGEHTFAIRYLRNTGANGFGDKVGWLIDGWNRAEVRNVGVPLGNRHHNRRTTFEAQGAGERLDNQLNRFSIGHGLASMVDEFPFNQCPTLQHSIPTEERIWGQGAIGTWDNFRVTVDDM